jgi:hypothetical protein
MSGSLSELISCHGNVFDFAGPYTIGVNDFSFGRVLKTAPLDVLDQRMRVGIFQGNATFGKKSHDLILNNCHSHVAKVLSVAGANGRSGWSGPRVFWYLLTRGKYVDWMALVQTYLASVVLYGAVLALFLL